MTLTTVTLGPSIDQYQAQQFARTYANAIAKLMPNQARALLGRLSPEQKRSLLAWDGTARNAFADRVIRAAVTQQAIRVWPTYDWSTFRISAPEEARRPDAQRRLRAEFLRVIQYADAEFRRVWSGRKSLLGMIFSLGKAAGGWLGEADPMGSFPSKRSRGSRRERIRLDAAQARRAGQRAGHKGAARETRYRARQRAQSVLQAKLRSDAAKRRMADLLAERLRSTMPAGLDQAVQRRFVSVLTGSLFRNFIKLIGNSDPSLDLADGPIGAVVGSAVAEAVNATGLVGRVSTEALSRAVYAIMTSQFGPELKVLGITGIMATTIAADLAGRRSPQREFEAFP